MAAPNLIATTTVIGKTVGANLTSTSATTVLSNADNSGRVYKVNTLNVANYGAVASLISINWNTGAALAGTNFPIVGNVSVPAGATLNVIDKTSQYYIEENQSIGATASSANVLVVTCSYEDIG